MRSARSEIQVAIVRIHILWGGNKKQQLGPVVDFK